jgi:hypothetical protein
VQTTLQYIIIVQFSLVQDHFLEYSIVQYFFCPLARLLIISRQIRAAVGRKRCRRIRTMTAAYRYASVYDVLSKDDGRIVHAVLL